MSNPSPRNPSPARPMPADFAKFVAIESINELSVRYKVRKASVTRWRNELGIPCMRVRGRRPDNAAPPENFAELTAQHCHAKLAKMLGVSEMKIRRWRKELGLERVVRPGSLIQRSADRVPWSPAVERTASHDGSRAGMAADFLRRLGPIFRCDDAGRARPDGGFWNRGGRTILTDDELIARAIRNGWKPDAWREIAA